MRRFLDILTAVGLGSLNALFVVYAFGHLGPLYVIVLVAGLVLAVGAALFAAERLGRRADDDRR